MATARIRRILLGDIGSRGGNLGDRLPVLHRFERGDADRVGRAFHHRGPGFHEIGISEVLEELRRAGPAAGLSYQGEPAPVPDGDERHAYVLGDLEGGTDVGGKSPQGASLAFGSALANDPS